MQPDHTSQTHYQFSTSLCMVVLWCLCVWLGGEGGGGGETPAWPPAPWGGGYLIIITVRCLIDEHPKEFSLPSLCVDLHKHMRMPVCACQSLLSDNGFPPSDLMLTESFTDPLPIIEAHTWNKATCLSRRSDSCLLLREA